MDDEEHSHTKELPLFSGGSMKSSNFLSRLLIETSREFEQPSVFTLSGAVAFCDISGFTKMTSEFEKKGSEGIESLGKLLNSHYESLISTMLAHGGDVIAIIGDAALVLFSDGALLSSKKISPTFQSNFSFPRKAAGEISTKSGTAAASGGQSKLANHCLHAIRACLDALSSNKSGLNMHIGISCGTLHALHVGGWHGKAQFLLVGEPLKHLQSTVSAAKSGQLCISAGVHSILSSVPSTSFSFTSVKGSDDWLVTKMQMSDALAAAAGAIAQLVSRMPNMDALSLADLDPRLDTLLSAYLSDSVVNRYLDLGIEDSGSSGVDWLAEWRRLTVVFVKLHGFEHIQSGDQVHRLNQSFVAIQKSVQAHQGSVLHAFNDDKGIIAMLAFGLPLEAHENDPSRAVSCALALQNDLSKRGVKASLGMTTGHVFCGCLGSPQRKDFTVLGSLVNLAARLMSSVTHESSTGILCDESTKLASELSFPFLAHHPITVKGFSEPVNIFEPTTTVGGGAGVRGSNNFRLPPLSASGGSKRPNVEKDERGNALIGRDKEMSVIVDAAESWEAGYSPVVFISGDAGMGKSMLTSATINALSNSHHRRAIFRVKTDNFVPCEFHAWSRFLSQAIEYSIQEQKGGMGLQTKSPSARANSQTMENFLTTMFTQRHSGLFPFLSLLNPFLHTKFAETKESSMLTAVSRSEYLIQISKMIVFDLLAIVPVCLCIEDVHAWDPLSWSLAFELANFCLEKSRARKEAGIYLRRASSFQKRRSSGGSGSGSGILTPPNSSDPNLARASTATVRQVKAEFNVGVLSFGSEELITTSPTIQHAPNLTSPSLPGFLASSNSSSSKNSSPTKRQHQKQPQLSFGTMQTLANSNYSELPHFFNTSGGATPNLSSFGSKQSQLSGRSSSFTFSPSSATHPLFLIFNSRTSKKDIRDQKSYKNFRTLSKDLCVLDLTPLNEISTASFIQELVEGADQISPDVSSFVHQLSQGNALFVRELSLSLIQQKMFFVDKSGMCGFSADFFQLPMSTEKREEIPQTIYDVIRTRLDSLTPDQQMLMKVASVLGSTFSLELLRSIHPSHLSRQQVSDCVNGLEDMGMLTVIPEYSEISFNHHMMQEVSYSLLTPSQKIDLHVKVAMLLEKRPNLDPNSCGFLQPQQQQQSSDEKRSFSSAASGGGESSSPRSNSVTSPLLLSVPSTSNSASQNSPGGGDRTPSTFSARNSAVFTLSSSSRDSGSGLKSGESTRSSSGSSARGILPVLAYHWMCGKAPEKARAYLARLAEDCHDNYSNRDAIRWFTSLFEQESECLTKSKPLVLSKWCRYVGECHYSLGDHDSAYTWLLRALSHASFELPKTEFSMKRSFLKESIVQYYRRKSGNLPTFDRKKHHHHHHELAILECQIKALSTLKSVCFFNHKLMESGYYTVLGANMCETAGQKLSSECSVFYAGAAHLLGWIFSGSWADQYVELANKTAQTDVAMAQVAKILVPYFVWSCHPRAPKAIEDGLALTSSIRCFKEMGIVCMAAIEHSFHHGLTGQYHHLVEAFREETQGKEDAQLRLYAFLETIVLSLMIDDRLTASAFIKKIAIEFPPSKLPSCLLPICSAILIQRDIRCPLSSSPFLRPSDCDLIFKFSRLSPSPTSAGAGPSPPASTIPHSSSHDFHPSFFRDFTQEHFFDFSDPSATRISHHLGDPVLIEWIEKFVDVGFSNFPDLPHGIGYFHAFHFGLELVLLHETPCDPKLLKSVLKSFQKSANHLQIFQPMAKAWGAFSQLKENPNNSTAFLQLQTAAKLAAQTDLPLQESFSHFFFALALIDLMALEKSGKIKSKKIQKICGVEPPFAEICNEKLAKAGNLLGHAGFSYYSEMVSKFTIVLH